MLQNYFKIAWRNLFRNKGFSLTNLLGLTIGMTCTILIFLWVQDELAYDRFHENHRNIYQVIAHRNFNNQIFTDRNMVLPLAQSLQTSSPQIKNAVVMKVAGQHDVRAWEIHLVRAGSLPRTPSGKIQRHRCSQLSSAPPAASL